MNNNSDNFISLIILFYIEMDQYEVIQNIGKGSFGVVTKVCRKMDGKFFVWKELNYGKMTEREKQ